MKTQNYFRKVKALGLMIILTFGFSIQKAKAKKNVLFIMSDDFNYWTSKNGYYPHAKTPNIDRLGNMGVFFREAHCSSPVCNPSRNALWSGIRPSTSGIDGNGDGYIREVKGFEDVVTMNQYFKENGYWVYGAGKLYHPKMSKTNHETDPENWSFINENGHGCNGGNLYQYCNKAKSNYCYSANPDAMTRGNCNDFNLAHDVKEVLEAYPTSAQKDMPFFIACGVFRPHVPWNSPLSFWNLFNYEELSIPPAYNADTDDPGNNVHQDFVNNGQWMRAIQAYLASCALADHNVGIMIDALFDSQYKDSTIVVFCGDHGWNLGEKGRWGKFDVCDEANHTTMIIYDPSAEGNGQECIKPVSLQDLYPTLIDLCGVPQRKNVEGNSLRALMDDPDSPDINSFALMMYGGKHYIKTDEWRFIDDGNNSTLHNNISDPFQWTNLYGQSEYSGVVTNLRHMIDSIVGVGTDIKANYFEFMPPNLPSQLTAQALSSTAVLVSWKDNANNEQGYNIYRKSNIQETYELLAQVNANTEFYTDETVTNANTYSYFIEVYNSLDTLALIPFSGVQPADVAPAKPENFVAASAGIGQVMLSWTDNSLNEDNYVVYRQVNNSGEFTKLIELDADVTSYADNNVDSSNVYAYYVAAVNGVGSVNSETVVNVKPQESSYMAIAYDDVPWAMPGANVMAWKYDKVGTGKDWKADSSVVIGLYNTSASGAGQDIRSYGNACPYPAARWNGGGLTMRENGHWMRYTCSFESGEYILKNRGRDNSIALKFTLRSANDLSEIYTATYNYPSDFTNAGSGGDGSGVTIWYECNNSFTVAQGTYVVELEVQDVSIGGILGEFTFLKVGTGSAMESATTKNKVFLNTVTDSGLLHLDLTLMNPAAWVKIMNLNGQVVQDLFVGGEEVISVELNPDLPAGMYIVTVDDSEQIITKKIVNRKND